MKVMLEDDYTDVLGKALIGAGLDLDELAKRADVEKPELERFASGKFVESVARVLAPVLNLDAEAFATLPEYQPLVPELEGVRRLVLPFGPYDVNAWWLELDGVRVLFDAGYQAKDLMGALPAMPDHVFITHEHRDHVGAVEDLIARGVEMHPVSDIKAGDSLACGPLTIRASDLSGHATPQLGYHVEGLERPLVVMGDALFAGSIGKCASPKLFQHALDRLHCVLDGLSEDTVLLPGHGPATTVGEERERNPFL